mmetsp:Transcript_62552/g.149096  ORF Transcript_62552/g.149096 Transcript_62552/m.149096 type:complete len:280 (-) Transcript_62552:237-1076(-)
MPKVLLVLLPQLLQLKRTFCRMEQAVHVPQKVFDVCRWPRRRSSLFRHWSRRHSRRGRGCRRHLGAGLRRRLGRGRFRRGGNCELLRERKLPGIVVLLQLYLRRPFPKEAQGVSLPGLLHIKGHLPQLLELRLQISQWKGSLVILGAILQHSHHALHEHPPKHCSLLFVPGLLLGVALGALCWALALCNCGLCCCWCGWRCSSCGGSSRRRRGRHSFRCRCRLRGAHRCRLRSIPRSQLLSVSFVLFDEPSLIQVCRLSRLDVGRPRFLYKLDHMRNPL